MHPTRQQPSIMVTHPWMGKGGSEATAMWTLQALQEDARVTLLTASEVDLDQLNATYGTAVSSETISIRRSSRLPGLRRGNQLVHLQQGLFESHCRKFAPDFDLCISAYNPVDFGRPGIQLIGDMSFSEEMRLRLYPIQKYFHHQSLLRRLYLAAGDALQSREKPPLAERGDLVVANSKWIAALLRTHFGIPNAPVLYPPVRLPKGRLADDSNRDPFGFVWLGRISPEKKVEVLISILSKVRSAGYPVSLQIGGQSSPGTYSREIHALIDQENSWITDHGFLDAAGKEALLASQSFSIHCNEVEPFGIAVAEMAAAGCLPFVPASGGASEIVTAEELRFEDAGRAVEKISALLDRPEHARELRSEAAHSVKRFEEAVFMRELRQLVKACLNDPDFTRTTMPDFMAESAVTTVAN